MHVETRAEWNSLIDSINTLAAAPPMGCYPATPLSHVGSPHILSKADVALLQNKLLEICGDDVFVATDFWKKATIDDIQAAVAAGWCNCYPTDCTDIYADICTQSFIEALDSARFADTTPGTCSNVDNEASGFKLGANSYWGVQWVEARVNTVETPNMYGLRSGSLLFSNGDVGFVKSNDFGTVDSGPPPISFGTTRQFYTPTEANADLLLDILTRALNRPCAIVGEWWVGGAVTGNAAPFKFHSASGTAISQEYNFGYRPCNGSYDSTIFVAAGC